ncbi:pyridoxamine 5'-phosphate oxidase-related protein FMN-binding [Beutenbergia cavernae DSM 12333]|uniref:Pyridoxamine 5'-phosphate oxidase-related protein FMN-binding n=1 Tax=Beutenbergia cavernae (strain ATCC BAA-8 / DSM 12333 / CCUG 43141 / JCM 11478 / NBRC 16432 / NCIMB 13614 / HKI 0122) TaxID=471853 RepID=C5C4A8_BEUC1|nr:pyridoxamine 5'-phosphate oxidase family protein [Beutenbergia cavernae]ACQ82032.1 pyridoxamine 5'-phosphate oxidase-related protein FMN-binding [Beutenbergia cavernae DSM 12333]
MAEEISGNPLEVLARWVEDAAQASIPAPSTMTFATADAAGVPHARTVLVTAIDDTALRFHSSAPTTKTRDLAARHQASGVFHWPALGRQVVVHGPARELDAAVARAAFGEQPRQLQLVAWAYDELLPTLDGPEPEIGPGEFRRAFDCAALRDPADRGVPESWTTIELAPSRVDLWQAGDDLTPPSRTRFVLGPAGTWRRFPVLP